MKLSRLILFTIVLISCQRSPEDITINKYSHTISDPSEKLRLFYKYMKHPPGLLDVEYHLWYQDNGAKKFIDVPGPSDYQLKVVLKVAKDSIDHHLTGLSKTNEEIDLKMWSKLQLDSTWNVSSVAEVYQDGDCGSTTKAIFRKEGIIFAYYATWCWEGADFDPDTKE
jgi:hypothetical protein